MYLPVYNLNRRSRRAVFGPKLADVMKPGPVLPGGPSLPQTQPNPDPEPPTTPEPPPTQTYTRKNLLHQMTFTDNSLALYDTNFKSTGANVQIGDDLLKTLSDGNKVPITTGSFYMQTNGIKNNFLHHPFDTGEVPPLLKADGTPFKYCGKLSLRPNETYTLSNGVSTSVVRSEWVLPRDTTSSAWLGQSLYLPSKYWKNLDTEATYVTQFHEVKDGTRVVDGKTLYEDDRTPPLGTIVSASRLKLIINWAAAPVSSTPEGKKVIDLGEFPFDKWVDFVWYYLWDYAGNGRVVLYMRYDGQIDKMTGKVTNQRVKVADYFGPVGYNDFEFPYPKGGIYKRNWYSDAPALRVIYIGAIRHAGPNAAYNDVARIPYFG